MQDRQATTKRIQQSFEAHLAAAGVGDLLVLYYNGRGEELKIHYYGYEESDDEWVTGDRKQLNSAKIDTITGAARLGCSRHR